MGRAVGVSYREVVIKHHVGSAKSIRRLFWGYDNVCLYVETGLLKRIKKVKYQNYKPSIIKRLFRL